MWTREGDVKGDELSYLVSQYKLFSFIFSLFWLGLFLWGRELQTAPILTVQVRENFEDKNQTII